MKPCPLTLDLFAVMDWDFVERFPLLLDNEAAQDYLYRCADMDGEWDDAKNIAVHDAACAQLANWLHLCRRIEQHQQNRGPQLTNEELRHSLDKGDARRFARMSSQEEGEALREAQEHLRLLFDVMLDEYGAMYGDDARQAFEGHVLRVASSAGCDDA
jgi:hypothetical protein